MNIGYINPEYGTRRNVLSCWQSDVFYYRIRPWMSFLNKAFPRSDFVRKFSRMTAAAYNGGVLFNFRKIDLLHMWNRVPVFPSTLPFVVSFEDTVPRNFGVRDLYFEKCINRLLSDKCRRLIAFSECAKLHQQNFNIKHEITEIDSKINVLLPPQDLLITEDEIYAKFKKVIPLKLVFVGKAFFRKGGYAVVRALTRLKQKVPLKLTIIGNVDYFDYAASKNVDDSNKAKQLIEDNKDWIDYYPVMPNCNVLKLLKEAHVGLLPTRDDTFGYSVLEMQAAGMPCITTDVWSLPEVNNDSCGFIIPLKKNNLRQANYFTDDGIENLENTIEISLMRIFEYIFDNLHVLNEKALLSRKNILKNHSPEKFSDRLYQIYKESIG